jgi:eukaryotic-like serine/threonine-protein kinase
MTQEQWRAVFEVFHAASQLPPDERQAFVTSSGHDPLVLQEALKLLEKEETDSAGVSGSVPTPSLPSDSGSLVNSSVGCYVITGLLGRGGMGEVYAARDPELDRMSALKLVAPEAVQGRSIERLIREAKTASALNHPNIVTVYEEVQSDSVLAIAMELVNGITLRVLCSKPLPVPKVLDYGEQIARALAAAHEHGIVHRDIKPENVMVREDGYVKVLDFGLAAM